MSMTTEDISIGVDCSDLNNPPDQDSPTNILNILNDFCIQSIFRHLTNLSDFVNAANVCTIFRDNAIGCFALIFKRVDVYSNPSLNFEAWKTHNNPKLSIQQQQSLLEYFGHLIFGIRIHITEYGDYDHSLFKSVIELCGQNLIELSVYADDERLRIDRFESRFPCLTVLHLMHVRLEHLVFGANLEELRLSHIRTENLKSLIRTYPKLKVFDFDTIYEVGHFEDEEGPDATFPFLKFLDLNPQIMYLRVYDTLYEALENTGYDEITLEDIDDRLPNLKWLDCDTLRTYENDAPIFTKLKYIYVHEVEDSELHWLSQNMPNLRTIQIAPNDCFDLEAHLEILEWATNLKRLYIDEIGIDAEDYNLVLSAIETRGKPCYVRFYDIYNVPSEIIDTNSKLIGTV